MEAEALLTGMEAGWERVAAGLQALKDQLGAQLGER